MKKLLISIFISISIFGLLFFFWIKNKNDAVNKQTLIPHFSTPDLPSGKVGEYYEADIYASIIGSKVNMQITSIQIPQGLNLADCKQEFNLDAIKKPNTLIVCKLKGIPTIGGGFELVFKASAEGYSNKTIGRNQIFINQ